MIRALAATLLLSGILGPPAAAQHGQRTPGVTEGADFRVYGPEGEPRSFAEVLAAFDDAEAVLVGEIHNDRVGHGVEVQLLVRAAERFGVLGENFVERRALVLSLEMFERDVQLILDEYLDGLITEDLFLESARPWDNYQEAYKPLVEFARGHGVPVVAANAPRRYVNRVTRHGPDSLADLSGEAKRFLPPLPYPGPSQAYREQFMAQMMEAMEEAPDEEEALGEEEAGGEEEASETEAGEEAEEREAPPNHGTGFAIHAQALWDAAMSHAIAGALDERPDGLVVHYVGRFHVARGTGIPEKIPEYRPRTRVLTVAMATVEALDAWDPEEHGGLGDFVILTLAPPEA